MADGVLGCTSDAGLVTLIRGWNWYAGADATAIGADQYDFATVMTHEIGHALGLGHSIDGASVMYIMLASGSARRSMTTQDLNVPDSDGGPTGLHAALSFHNVAGEPAASSPSPTSSTGVAVLDQVLAGWKQADTGSSNGIAHRVSGQGTHFVVQPLVATRSTPSNRSGMVIDPGSAEVLLAQGGSTRSLFADSTPPIRKKLFGSSTL
jgi:Matrixin